jgi:hypothetical protein
MGVLAERIDGDQALEHGDGGGGIAGVEVKAGERREGVVVAPELQAASSPPRISSGPSARTSITGGAATRSAGRTAGAAAGCPAEARASAPGMPTITGGTQAGQVISIPSVPVRSAAITILHVTVQAPP